MHPALSVIIFTAASGAGYGLLAWAGLFLAGGALSADNPVCAIAVALASVLFTVGLLTSTFHLGHPERAWRALSQWRSSWLSREGVLAILTYIPAGLLLLVLAVPGRVDLPPVPLGLVAAVAGFATIYATGRIYATLTTIPAWNNALVVPGYLLIGALGGALIGAAIAALLGAFEAVFATAVLVLAILCGLIKNRYWRAIDAAPAPAPARSTTARSTTASATTLGRAGEPVRLLDAPTTSETYIHREMGFRIARKHAGKLRRITNVTLFLIPALSALAALFAGDGYGLMAIALVGVASGTLGTAVERWLFFAEAKHVAMLYYGAETA